MDLIVLTLNDSHTKREWILGDTATLGTTTPVGQIHNGFILIVVYIQIIFVYMPLHFHEILKLKMVQMCYENIWIHSMARANLNKSVWLVTNTTMASKYIYKRTRICINWNPPFRIQILFSKSTSKCEHCETRFTS